MKTFLYVCFALPIMVCAQVVNPVKNSSFESLASDGSALNWTAQYGGYAVATTTSAWDGQRVLALVQGSTPTAMLGTLQRITFNQAVAKPIRISARVKGQNIQDVSTDKYGASLYCRVSHTDGSMDWCPTTVKTKQVGTFGWILVGFNTSTFVNGAKPIAWVEVIPVIGQVSGTAWFDDVHVEEHTAPSTGFATLMFDDSLEAHHSEVLPVLNRYGFKASAAIVTSYVDTTGHMSLSEVKDLVANGWEIVNHTVHHKDMTTLDPVSMEDEYYFALQWFHQNGFVNIKNFALPFGAYNGLVIRTGQIYHRSIRSSDRGFNSAGVYPYNVMVQELQSSTTVADVQSWLNTARDNKQWLIIFGHDFQPTCGSNVYCMSNSMFETVIGAVANSGLPVVTYDQGFTAMNAQ